MNAARHGALVQGLDAQRRKHTKKNATEIERVGVGSVLLEHADAATRYSEWPDPTTIVVDGPYGVAGFPGDPPTPGGLAHWYAPHVAAWSEYALPSTTLWFWGTEVGWASVHPVLDLHGWDYRALHVWDKGVAHIAGNVNSRTIRGFPVVTEVCAQYVRRVELPTEDGQLLSLRQWLRHEWQRTELPLYLTNEACGVKNAATRKYFTQDHMWYFPPPEMMVLLAQYAAKHGKATTRPYFSLDGKTPVTAEEWSKLRSKWNHEHAVTNVWTENALRGIERRRSPDTGKFLHTNQKPLSLMERIIRASSEPGDVVWEPFGGLASAAVAALRLGRLGYAAEIQEDVFRAAVARLIEEADSETASG